MTGKLMLTAGMLALLTTVFGAPSTPANATPARKNSSVSRNAEKDELAKIQELELMHREFIARIQKKRMELLKTNPKLAKMYLELLKVSRELAVELDSDPEIQELNEARYELERKLNKLRKRQQQRKK